MKPINNKLGDEALKSILQAERAAAIGSAMSSDLSEQRIRAYDYYMGDMTHDMPAGDGESKAVSSDVQDVVEGMLPIILDVLTSGENVVEFAPRGPGDEAAAQQETDAVNYVFYQENDGFLILYTLIKDALLSKNSFVKWWMEEQEERERENYEGLSEDALAALAADEDVKIVHTEQYDAADPVTQQPARFYNATTERVKTVKKRKVAAVPPEEIIISKNARNVADAPYLAHISPKPQADLISLYPDKAEIIKRAPVWTAVADNGEANNRQTVMDTQDGVNTTESVNRDMRMVELCEHYIRLCLEGDDIARRYKICTVGTTYEVLDIEEVPAWPLASGTSIIMPHRLFGRAPADLVIEIQQIKTSLLRATLNNAYYANNQRVEVSETHSSENTIDDLLNNRVGGIVRTKMPGGLKQLETQPIGHWVMPVIEHMDTVRENRTGISRYNQGLDADSLNHTATGVTRIMDAAEMRIKLAARTFAETLIVDMFRGIHQMIQQFGEEKFEVETTGGWIPVNPREWKKRQHMKVSLPLGGASRQMLLQFFMQVLGVQKDAALQQGGMNGPLVSWQNIYATTEQMTKLAGVKSAKPFFMQPGPPDPNAPPPPNPEMMKAQAQGAALQQKTQGAIAVAQTKAQADTQIAQAKATFEAQLATFEARMEHQREQDIAARQMMNDRMELNHKMLMEALGTAHGIRIDAFEANERAKLARDTAAQQPAAAE